MKNDNMDFYDIENYWVKRKKYCKTFFSRAAMNGKKALIARYGKRRGSEILNRIGIEYERLLPFAPYVGEIDLMRRQMLLTVIFAGFYKVLKDEEQIGDIWELCNDFNKQTLMSMPGFVRKMIKKSTFSEKSRKIFQESAVSQRKENLADQWDYISGEGKSYTYGMNITRCAKMIFLQKSNIAEFGPYICLIDKNFAECCGYGIVRTQVIAEGSDYCDFRFSEDGPVDVRTCVK